MSYKNYKYFSELCTNFYGRLQDKDENLSQKDANKIIKIANRLEKIEGKEWVEHVILQSKSLFGI